MNVHMLDRMNGYLRLFILSYFVCLINNILQVRKDTFEFCLSGFRNRIGFERPLFHDSQNAYNKLFIYLILVQVSLLLSDCIACYKC